MHSLLTKEETKQTALLSEGNQRIFTFLKSNPVGVLSTIDTNGDPHGSVVYYSVNESFDCTFVTKRDTKKYDNLSHNNHAMIVVHDTFTQTTVQITGKVEDISDQPDAHEAFASTLKASMSTSDSGIPPISKLQAGHYVAFKLKPVQVRMAMFIRPDSGGYESIFETIDFDN